ncbi:MAG TPA: NAD(P) transhydrogenase subunit alpha [Acidimicrobiales bacterium]
MVESITLNFGVKGAVMSETTTGEPAESLADAGEPVESPRRREVVGIVKERGKREGRVAVVPEGVAKLRAAGVDVLVEAGAGSAAWIADEAYVTAGAEVVALDELIGRASLVVMVNRPGPELVEQLRAGQAIVGLLQLLADPSLAEQLAVRGVTAISLDGLPRTLSRAQSMDALSSQASIAGYKAAVLAADTYARYFPMMITASGTAKPADVLVLGAGVAGLQAMGTARRLGAVVTGYDVRPETKGEVESLGARFLALTSISSGSGEGGYARELSVEEQLAQQEELNSHIARRDVVITTAQVPGRRPPLLVTGKALDQMRPGAVLIDMGASELGGNVEGSLPGETTTTERGVIIVGASNLAGSMPAAASAAYSHNVTSLLLHLLSDGALRIDLDDEIQAGVVVTCDGRVVHGATAAILAQESGLGGVQ